MHRLHDFSVGAVNPNLDGPHHERYNVPTRPVALSYPRANHTPSIIVASSIEIVFAPGGPHKRRLETVVSRVCSLSLWGNIRGGVPNKVGWVHVKPRGPSSVFTSRGAAVPVANHRDPDRLCGSAAVTRTLAHASTEARLCHTVCPGIKNVWR